MKEHVTEYGVHWNFFLTLALIPVLRATLRPFITIMSISLLGLLVALGTLHNQIMIPLNLHLRDGIAHQLSLSAGLTSYVLNAARQGLIGANKEGLVSLPG